MVNPLKDIEDKMNEFANSSADFSDLAPEKLIDIADKDNEGLGSGRDDFDKIMKDVIDNQDKIKEGLSVVRVPNPGTSAGSTVRLSHVFEGKPLKKAIADINGRWNSMSADRIYTDFQEGDLITSRQGGAVIQPATVQGNNQYFLVQQTESNLNKIAGALK